jgi:hypothetical protein
MLWAIYALLHSLFRAMFVETGRFFPADGWVKAFWQAFFGFLLLLPFLPLMQWPEYGRFYLAAVTVSLIMTVGTLLQLTLSQQQSGRISSVYMPIEAFAAFMIWLAIMPEALRALTSDPFRLCAVVLAFLLATVALLIVRPNDISAKTFSLVAPVGLSFAVAGVVTKIVLPASHLIPIVLTYALINFAVMTLVMALALLVKKKLAREAFSTPTIQGGVITGLFSASSTVTFVAGVALAPNPGYTSFMAMLLPVWMIGLHKLFRAEERASPVAAFLLVIGAVILIVAAL